MHGCLSCYVAADRVTQLLIAGRTASAVTSGLTGAERKVTKHDHGHPAKLVGLSRSPAAGGLGLDGSSADGSAYRPEHG